MCDWPRLGSLLQSVYERQDQSSAAVAARVASLERQIGKLHGQICFNLAIITEALVIITDPAVIMTNSWVLMTNSWVLMTNLLVANTESVGISRSVAASDGSCVRL